MIAVHTERPLEHGPGESRRPARLRRRPAAAKPTLPFHLDTVSELYFMVAIGVILLFVAAFAALNRIEFGRFD